MSDYLINNKAEEAIAALVTDLVSALDPVPVVVKGAATEDSSEDDLKNGLIECTAEGEGDEEVIGAGNFWVRGGIAIKHMAVPDEDGTNGNDDPKANTEAIVTAVSNGIISSTLADDLSDAATPFHVYNGSVTFESPTREEDPNGFWVHNIRWKMLCCAADL